MPAHQAVQVNEESNGTCYSISGPPQRPSPERVIEAHPARATTLTAPEPRVGMYQREIGGERHVARG